MRFTCTSACWIPFPRAVSNAGRSWTSFIAFGNILTPEAIFTDKDASLRERQIKIIGDYAVTFWLDSPVHIIMVVDVRPADK